MANIPEREEDTLRCRAAAGVFSFIMLGGALACSYVAVTGGPWWVWFIALSSLLIGIGAVGHVRTGKWGHFRK